MDCFKQKYHVLRMSNLFKGLNFVSYNRIWKWKNALLSHKKQEAHWVENCRNPHTKNSALPVLHKNKQFIASKLANMFAEVWCYNLGLLASCLRRWIVFCYVTFSFSHHLAKFLVIFKPISIQSTIFITFHVLVCYELKK